MEERSASVTSRPSHPLADPVATEYTEAPEDRELVLAGVLGRHVAPVTGPTSGQQICEARPVVLEQRESRCPTPSRGALPSKRFALSSRLHLAKGASSAGCGKTVSGSVPEHRDVLPGDREHVRQSPVMYGKLVALQRETGQQGARGALGVGC